MEERHKILNRLKTRSRPPEPADERELGFDTYFRGANKERSKSQGVRVLSKPSTASGSKAELSSPDGTEARKRRTWKQDAVTIREDAGGYQVTKPAVSDKPLWLRGTRHVRQGGSRCKHTEPSVSRSMSNGSEQTGGWGSICRHEPKESGMHGTDVCWGG